MNEMARPLTSQAADLAFGVVTGVLDRKLLVRFGRGVRPAARAAGCLLAPEIGDRVLAATSEEGESFILAVLERASEEPAEVGLNEGFSLRSQAGPVALEGQNVRIDARERLDMAAAEVSVKAGLISMIGGALSQAFARTRLTAGSVERMAGRVVDRVRRLYRRVDGFENSRIGRLNLTVDKGMRVKAGRVDMNAEDALKLDGRKIHLG
jgi:hypothetical protein